ncbi:hypothetical protein HYC85_019454 [Camellia sinensis]|uniref:Uncharacterized protein n=1 Tax=Camellia sinensis TaxID=4442 RepID=A0A7J7GLW5_CAMSI|nr:hypothetical protein HYC85_019454 [Camellia sinensis]
MHTYLFVFLFIVQGKKSIDHISFANFGYFKGPAEASVDVVMFLGIQYPT